MDKVPGMGKTEAEKLHEKLEEEVAKWAALGLDHNSTRHTPASIYDLKIKLMTLTEIVRDKLQVTDEEFNSYYQTILLKDMQGLREVVEAQQEAQSKLEVPKLGIIGPNGEMLSNI